MAARKGIIQHSFSYILSLFCLSALCAEEIDQERCPKGPRSERISVRHIESKGLGYSQGYSSVDLFLSLPKTYWYLMPFIDARGHIFNNGKLAANGGLGLRSLVDSIQQVFGINVFYDYRKTQKRHYNQLSGGIEVLGKSWDYRLNVYVPVGHTQTLFYDYFFSFNPADNSFVLTAKREFAMKGADAEVGYHLPKMKGIELYSAFGPYYYSSFGSVGQHTTGGRVRFMGTFFTYLTLEAIVSYDHQFKWIGQGALELNFPFGGRKSVKKSQASTCSDALTLQNRMVQKVQHNEIIVVDKHRQSLK